MRLLQDNNFLSTYGFELYRYHWCKSQFLGYEDEANTYYIVPDINGSTKVIFTHAGTIVNRLDYDQLGKIRNQDTTPQVELLWRGMYQLNSDLGYVLDYYPHLYNPTLGNPKLFNNLMLDIAPSKEINQTLLNELNTKRICDNWNISDCHRALIQISMLDYLGELAYESGDLDAFIRYNWMSHKVWQWMVSNGCVTIHYDFTPPNVT